MNKTTDNNHTMVYLLTINDVVDQIYYIKAKNAKEAVIKLADYYGTKIRFLENIIDKITLEDVIDVLLHYGIDICTVLKVDYIAALYGSIGNDHVITIID